MRVEYNRLQYVQTRRARIEKFTKLIFKVKMGTYQAYLFIRVQFLPKIYIVFIQISTKKKKRETERQREAKEI